ncbi:hypothetical protein SDC9_69021 [bioreactor metagenome]|uniref:Uncharacterized protein n=1 Tax=bioreactor metagenome TaxID=1076179 RepID=A0A644Y8X7_9ZZZZ
MSFKRAGAGEIAQAQQFQRCVIRTNENARTIPAQRNRADGALVRFDCGTLLNRANGGNFTEPTRRNVEHQALLVVLVSGYRTRLIQQLQRFTNFLVFQRAFRLLKYGLEPLFLFKPFRRGNNPAHYPARAETVVRPPVMQNLLAVDRINIRQGSVCFHHPEHAILLWICSDAASVLHIENAQPTVLAGANQRRAVLGKPNNVDISNARMHCSNAFAGRSVPKLNCAFIVARGNQSSVSRYVNRKKQPARALNGGKAFLLIDAPKLEYSVRTGGSKA